LLVVMAMCDDGRLYHVPKDLKFYWVYPPRTTVLIANNDGVMYLTDDQVVEVKSILTERFLHDTVVEARALGIRHPYEAPAFTADACERFDELMGSVRPVGGGSHV
jgi:hypothetical protein